MLEDKLDVTVVEAEVQDQPGSAETHTEQAVGVEETVLLEKKSARPWRTLLTGLPDPVSNIWSLLTFLINTGLLLMALDFIYRAKLLHPSDDLSFARIGYVSPSEASLLIREPDASKLPIHVSYKLAMPAMTYEDAALQSAGTITSLSSDTDYTAPLKFQIPNYPDRVYQWTTSNNHTGR